MQPPPSAPDVLDSTAFDPREDPLLAEVFGEVYRIEWRLSIGGMSRVYRATHLPTGTPVAVKVITPSTYAAPSDLILSFEREAEVTRRLRHPHIVEVYDSGSTPRGERFLVMELLNGQDLAERLGERLLSPVEAVEIADQMLAALGYAHAQGVIHRDLKPGNIWLCGPRELPRVYAKLVDFGVARVQEGEDFSQPVIGTPAYMAPEQIQPDAPLDGRADLYALAMTLYEALGGRYPFEAKSLTGLFRQIMQTVPKPLHELRPTVPPALSEWLLRALAKQPNDRFADAETMRQALRPIRNGLLNHRSTTSRRIPRFFEAEALREQRRVAVLAARGPRDALAALELVLLQSGAVIEASEPGELLGVLGSVRSYGDEVRRAVSIALRGRRPECAALVSSRRLPPRPWSLRAAELLADVAPGEVRLDRDAYLLVRGLFDLRSADGGGYIVAGERPFGPGRRGVLGGESPTVGRARELAELQEAALSALERGVCGGRLLLGEAGLGKSRIKLELRRFLSESRRPFEYLEGQCEALDHARPFSSLARVLRLFGLEDASPQQALAAALGQLRELSRQGGLLVVLEDVQWADAATLDALRELRNALRDADGARVFFLGLARPERVEELTKAFPEMVRLEPLESADVRALVRAVVGEDDALESFVRNEARGNPFFAEEALQSLRDAGVLVHDGERWRRSGACRAGLSVGVECLLQAQIDALPQSERELVKRAALFDERVLSEALFSLGAAPESLAPVVRRGLLWERIPSETPGVRELFFRSPALREVAARLLPESERQELHGALGLWMASRPEPDATGAARHLARSGEREAAVGWFERAAQAEAREGRSKQAAALLGEALALSPAEAETCARLLLAREAALTRDGQRESAQEARKALAALVPTLRDARLRSLIELRALRALLAERSLETLSTRLEAARAHAAEAGDPEAEVELLLVESSAQAAQCKHEEARRTAEKAQALAFSLGKPALVVQSMFAQAEARAFSGDYYGARVQHGQCLIASRRFQDTGTEARVLVRLACLAYAVGRLASAELHAQDALRCVTRGAPLEALLDARLLLARVALGQQQDETAHGLLVEVRTHADAAKDEPRMARLRVGLAEMLLREGESESALDMAAEALELDASPWDWVAARTGLARAHQRRGDVSAALAHARAGREEVREAISQAPLPPEEDPEEMLEHLALVFAAAASPSEEKTSREESRALLRARAERIPDEATRFSFCRRPGMRRALYEAASQELPATTDPKDS